MRRYFLESHAFVRVIDGRAFFLDVRRDEYVCVANSATLAENVSGWPESVSAAGNEVPRRDDDTLAQLHAQGLLAIHGKTAEPANLPSATHDWLDEWRTVRPTTVARYLFPFVLAFVRTTLTWRLFSLEYNIKTLQRRVSRLAGRTAGKDAEVVRTLTGVFLLLRAWFYTSKDRCLFDSLVMEDFFSLCDCCPTFVIGIRIAPFGAHCWTQYDDCALNELDTRARRYAPILAIGA